MNMIEKALQSLGITNMHPKEPKLYHTHVSPTLKPNPTFKERQKYGLDLLNNAAKGNKPEEIIASIHQMDGLVMPTFVKNDIPIYNNYGDESRRAIKDLSQTDFLFYDLETTGSLPEHLRGTGNKFDSYGIGQISFNKTGYNTDGTVRTKTKATTLPNIMNKLERDTIQGYLTKLEQDPNYWLKMDVNQRRSVIDMGLYAEDGFFEKTSFRLNSGKSMELNVMTGQPDRKISTDSSAAAVREHLDYFKKGYANRNNPGYMNTFQDNMTVLDNEIDAITASGRKAVVAGHNIHSFDNRMMRRVGGEAFESTSFNKTLKEGSFDTLQASRLLAQHSNGFNPENFQLGTLFDFSQLEAINKKTYQSHFGGADVDMNSDVLGYMFKQSYQSPSVGSRTNLYEDLFNPEISTLNANERYVVTKGLPFYRENAFTQNEGEYHVAARLDPETNKFVASGDYQESIFKRGNQVQVLGEYGTHKINGIDHHALLLHDLSNDTHNIYFDSDINRMREKVGNSLTKVSDIKKDPTYWNYLKQDEARRHYEAIFDPKIRYEGDTIKKRVDSAFSKIDIFEKIAAQKGLDLNDLDNPKNQALYKKVVNLAYDQANENLNTSSSGKTFRYGRAKFESAIRNRNALTAERNELAQILNLSFDKKTGIKITEQQQNIQAADMIKAYHTEVLKSNPQADIPTLGHSGMKLYGINMSVKGDINYLDVNNPTTHQASISRLLNSGGTQSNGQILQKFQVLMSDAKSKSGNNSLFDFAQMQQDLEHQVLQDLQQGGRIKTDTIKNISNRLYAAHEMQSVSDIPNNSTSARVRALYLNQQYTKPLTGQESSFGLEIQQLAKAQSRGQMVDPSLTNAFELSEEVMVAINRTDDYLKHMDDMAHATHKTFVFDQAEIKKAGHRQTVYNTHKEITDTIDYYQNNGFNTAIQYNPNTKTTSLLFAFEDDGINFIGMTANDIAKNKKIGSQPLPLILGNGAIDIGGGTVTPSLKLDMNPNLVEGLQVSSTQPDMFKTLRNQAVWMKEQRERSNQFGYRQATEDIVQQGVGRTRRQNTQGRSSVSYALGLDASMTDQMMSPAKIYNQSMMVDTGPVLLNHMATNPKYANLNSDWINYSSQNTNASIFDSRDFWRRQQYDLSDVHMESIMDFNRSLGPNVNSKISFAGLNASQFTSGMAFMKDPRDTLSLGRYISPTRELSTKAQNYDPVNRAVLTSFYNKQNRQRLSEAGYSGKRLEEMVNRANARQIADNSQLDPIGLPGGVRQESATVKGGRTRAIYTNESDLYDKVNEVRPGLIQGYQSEIDELTAKINTTPEGPLRAKLNQDILELEKKKSYITHLNPSIFDGQALIRESFADSLQAKELRTLSLLSDERLPAELVERFAEDKGVKYLDGMGTGMADGLHTFDNPISYEEMQRLGLVDKNGMITVGELTRQAMDEDGFESSVQVASNAKRVSPDSMVLGISASGGKEALILGETKHLTKGSKLFELGGGGRYTLNSLVPDDIADLVMGKNVNFMAEHIKVDKDAYGTALNMAMNTVQDDIWENLEGINLSQYENMKASELGKLKASELTGLLPGVQSYFDEKQYTVQDLMKDDGLDNTFRGIYEPLVKDFGLESDKHYRFNKQTGRYELGVIGEMDGLVGETGQKNYTNFINTLRDQFGFSQESVSIELGRHDVTEYGGTSTQANMAYRENLLLGIKDRMYDTKPVHYRAHMDKLRDSQDFTEHRNLMSNILGMKRDLSSNESLSDIVNRADAGNIILDMSGAVATSDTANIFLDKNGNYQFNALALGEVKRGDDYTGTLVDPESIRVFNQELGIDTDIGTLLSENKKGKAFIRTQATGAGLFDQDYVHALPGIHVQSSLFETDNLEEIADGQRRIVNSAYRGNTMTTTQTLVRDGVEGEVGRISQEFASGMTRRQQAVASYATSSNKGGYIKNVSRSETRIGGAYNLQSLNQREYFDLDGIDTSGNQQFKWKADGPRAHEVMLGEDSLRTLISGNEEAILRMNAYDDDMLKEIGNFTDGAERQLSYQDEILRRLEGTGKDDFALYSQTNRYPSQDIGSIHTTSVRLDRGLQGENMQVSPITAHLLHGDYDGDKGYLNLDGYYVGKNADWTEQLKVQTDMRNMARQTEQAVQSTAVSLENIPDLFSALTDSKNVNQFKYYDDQVTFLQEYLTSYQRAYQIGGVSNTTFSLRQGTQLVQQSALDAGVIDADQYKLMTENFETHVSGFEQGMISAKKVTPEALGVDFDTLNKLSKEEQTEYLLGLGHRFTKERADFQYGLLSSNLGNVDYNVQEMLRLGFADTEEGAYDFITDIARANETLGESGLEGFYNTSFTVGKSTGDVSERFVNELASGNYHKLAETDATNAYIKGLDIEPEWQASNKLKRNTIASTYERVSKRNPAVDALNNAQTSQVQDLFERAESNRIVRSLQDSESIGNILRDGLSGVMDSTGFKVGAGFGAMFLVGSMLKRAPTPEGNEAQQEATPVEVAPAAMLTSPTARVTPNSENVHLSIQGQGNADQELVAGLINSYVSQQSGVPFQMNINLSDNTQKLDKNFYENTLSSILGI